MTAASTACVLLLAVLGAVAFVSVAVQAVAEPAMHMGHTQLVADRGLGGHAGTQALVSVIRERNQGTALHRPPVLVSYYSSHPGVISAAPDPHDPPKTHASYLLHGAAACAATLLPHACPQGIVHTHQHQVHTQTNYQFIW